MRAEPPGETRVGTLFLPALAAETPRSGTVVAVGMGTRRQDGTLDAPEVAVGDTVLYAPDRGTEFQRAGESLLLLRPMDLLAVIEPA